MYFRLSEEIVAYPPLPPSEGSATLSWGVPTQGTLGQSAEDILAAAPERRRLIFAPNGKIWLNIGADASPTFKLFELNGGDTLDLDVAITRRVSAIAENPSTTYTLMVAT